MTYLLISCNECGSYYMAKRVLTSHTRSTINFCMYCASNRITLTQLNTEQTWIEYMAEKYGKSTTYIETMLEAFESLPKGAKTTFAAMCGSK